ncbi:winged helix-turn-helix domain-containing protein [Aeromonas sanarellii]|uniref:winged helix-turn-helix domain-containing protein n=1 Tax=Aeromonas sanarellii TaxID=633415 RepID=UPI003BA29F23
MSDLSVLLVYKEKGFIFDLTQDVFLPPPDDPQRNIIKIGRRERDTLLYLIERQGNVVSREEILNAVWVGAVVSEANVSMVLSSIRKLIKRIDKECLCLKTVDRKGYAFTPEKSGLSVEIKETEYQI